MMKVWVVLSGDFGTAGGLEAVCATEETADAVARRLQGEWGGLFDVEEREVYEDALVAYANSVSGGD